MPRMAIGILAFGSLLADPGEELKPCVVRRKAVKTPFAVEFARESSKRCGAPTLVPVDPGRGTRLDASVLILKDTVDEESACDMLYRRETWRVGEAVSYCDARSRWIHTLPGFDDVHVCLYTALEANIDPLTVERLAELAISSAAKAAGANKHDGTSYLREQKLRGVETPLMPRYQAEVLSRTGSEDLAEAWERIRRGAYPGS